MADLFFNNKAKEVTGHWNLAKIYRMKCVFCERISLGKIILQTDLAVAFPDKFPVSPGHMLILPRRHEMDFFKLTEEEQTEIWGLIPLTQKHIEKRHSPDGYNIGINSGKAAGQTVAHAHLHIIPRYLGDIKDPRGGIRWVLPSQARYWEEE
jgi:diadenosine tetraphosphate (Ap4A) HIT family hydrolase